MKCILSINVVGKGVFLEGDWEWIVYNSPETLFNSYKAPDNSYVVIFLILYLSASVIGYLKEHGWLNCNFHLKEEVKQNIMLVIAKIYIIPKYEIECKLNSTWKLKVWA